MNPQAHIEEATNVEMLTIQPRTMEQFHWALVGRRGIILFLLFLLLLLGASAAGFSPGLAAGGAGGWLLGVAAVPPVAAGVGSATA